MSRFAKKLEKVKFVCKEMWIELFHKQADKLRTNYVRHVLHDFRVGSAARTTMSSMRCAPHVCTRAASDAESDRTAASNPSPVSVAYTYGRERSRASACSAATYICMWYHPRSVPAAPGASQCARRLIHFSLHITIRSA